MAHRPAEQRVAKRSSSSHSGNRNVLSGEFFSPRNHPTNTNKSSMSSMSLTEHTSTVSSKKSCGSASTHSSLGKKLANISFSGSEAESVCFESSASTTPAQYNLAMSPCLVRKNVGFFFKKDHSKFKHKFLSGRWEGRGLVCLPNSTFSEDRRGYRSK